MYWLVESAVLLLAVCRLLGWAPTPASQRGRGRSLGVLYSSRYTPSLQVLLSSVLFTRPHPLKPHRYRQEIPRDEFANLRLLKCVLVPYQIEDSFFLVFRIPRLPEYNFLMETLAVFLPSKRNFYAIERPNKMLFTESLTRTFQNLPE